MLRRIAKLIRFDGDSLSGSDKGLRWAEGTSVPDDGSKGYAKGCHFIKTDGGVGTTLYVNEGSATSADFNAAIT